VLNALYAHRGIFTGAERLAYKSFVIEMIRCGKVLGKQDHYSAAYGGFQFIQFNSDESVYVDPIICKPETRRTLEASLMMFYTGLTRSSNQILREQSSNTTSDPKKKGVLKEMVNLAHQLRSAIQNNNLQSFGDILNAGWEAKRSLAADISNPQIDDWYTRSLKAGALGGKILGAGGGGFLLLFAPPERHQEIIRVLPELRPIPFSFEPQGSKIIYIEENG
jgi:D-glycero-alpha-D-manno-heptose-7-phosphate kinase